MGLAEKRVWRKSNICCEKVGKAGKKYHINSDAKCPRRGHGQCGGERDRGGRGAVVQIEEGAADSERLRRWGGSLSESISKSHRPRDLTQISAR